MRRLQQLLLLACLALLPAHGWGATAHVAGEFKLINMAGTTTGTFVLTTNPTAGNTLVGGVIWPDQSVNLSSVTGSANCNVTYTLKNANYDPATLSSSAANFYSASTVAGGACTLTFTFDTNGAGNAWFFVHEASGVRTSSDPYDNSVINGQAAPGSGTDAVTSTAVTITDGAYVMAYTGDLSFGGSGIAAGTGFTSRTGGDYNESESLIKSGTSSIAGTFTATSGTGNWVTGVISLLPPATEASTRSLMLLGVGQ